MCFGSRENKSFGPKSFDIIKLYKNIIILYVTKENEMNDGVKPLISGKTVADQVSNLVIWCFLTMSSGFDEVLHCFCSLCQK